MPRPDDDVLAVAARRALGVRAAPIRDRRLLHAAPGRAVEAVRIAGRALVVKWRDDRPADREALLYQGLSPGAHRLLGSAPMLGATGVAGTHLLFLAWVDGVHPDWSDPGDVHRAFAHLGRLHAGTARLIRSAPGALATDVAWRELGPEPGDADGEPLVLDPGDLHAENFLLLPGGGVCLVDFENMAVRPRDRALRQLGRDRSMPRGRVLDLALCTYWAAAGWEGDAAAFRRRVRGNAGDGS